MINEGIPYRKYIPQEDGGGFDEVRSQGRPEDLDPYGEVPFEAQELVDDVLVYKATIEGIIPEYMGHGGIDAGEAIVGASRLMAGMLEMKILFFCSTKEGDRLDDIHLFELYDNGMGVVKNLKRRWWSTGEVEERIVSQRFLGIADFGRLKLIQPLITR